MCRIGLDLQKVNLCQRNKGKGLNKNKDFSLSNEYIENLININNYVNKEMIKYKPVQITKYYIMYYPNSLKHLWSVTCTFNNLANIITGVLANTSVH